jgi:hypothetical protein
VAAGRDVPPAATRVSSVRDWHVSARKFVEAAVCVRRAFVIATTAIASTNPYTTQVLGMRGRGRF